MSTTFTSPFATPFKSALKRGTSYNEAVNNIASRNHKSPQQVWESLFKAGLCFRQKFNGQWIYFPWNAAKTSSTTWKKSQFNAWQWFSEWCLTSGTCTPEQFKNHCGAQKSFMTWCRKYFGKQFTWSTTSNSRSSNSRSSKSSSNKSRSRRTSTAGSSFSFPAGRSRKTRRFSRAA